MLWLHDSTGPYSERLVVFAFLESPYAIYAGTPRQTRATPFSGIAQNRDLAN